MNRRRLYFLIYYLAAALTISLVYGSYDWLGYYRLVNRGSVTSATVTAIDCLQSRTISYRFVANGREYAGSGGDSYGNPPCAAIKTGELIQVAYLASSPETNIPGNPKERLANETIAVLTAAAIVPLVLLFLFFVISRRFTGQKG